MMNLGRGRCRVFRVNTGHRCQQNRRVPNRARHWSGCVLAVRTGNNSVATDKTERRLYTDDAVHPGRADHGPIRFSSNCDDGEVCGNSNAGAAR